MNEKIKGLSIPNELSRLQMAETYAQGLLGLLNVPAIDIICETLSSKKTLQLINSGKITFAMIKPDLNNAADIASSSQLLDSDIAALLTNDIKKPLEVILEVSFVFTDEMIEYFYEGGPKNSQINVAPMNQQRYNMHHETRWDEFKALMKQGPVTGLVIYSRSGQAVKRWRNQMGNEWRIDKVKKSYPKSLRAKYGKDNHNNMLHGSDSIDSVKREIDFFISALQEYQRN